MALKYALPESQKGLFAISVNRSLLGLLGSVSPGNDKGVTVATRLYFRERKNTAIKNCSSHYGTSANIWESVRFYFQDY